MGRLLEIVTFFFSYNSYCGEIIKKYICIFLQLIKIKKEQYNNIAPF